MSSQYEDREGMNRQHLFQISTNGITDIVTYLLLTPIGNCCEHGCSPHTKYPFAPRLITYNDVSHMQLILCFFFMLFLILDETSKRLFQDTQVHLISPLSFSLYNIVSHSSDIYPLNYRNLGLRSIIRYLSEQYGGLYD